MNYTWLKVGGKAKLFKAENLDELIHFSRYNAFFILGAGSNILAGDRIESIILKLGRNFNYLSYEDGKIIAGAAALQSNLAKLALENSIGGFEFFSTIPGTIGGAVAMNAGSYNCETKDLVTSATFIADNGEIITLSKEEIGFQYRSNSLPSHYICIEVIFDATNVVPRDSIKSIMLEMIRKKQESQPIFSKTAGSIFKNPVGYKAWELIEKAGFRGFSIGKAQISEQHCNFVINHGCESSENLIDLCRTVKDGVREKLGITLDFEMRFL